MLLLSLKVVVFIFYCFEETTQSEAKSYINYNCLVCKDLAGLNGVSC